MQEKILSKVYEHHAEHPYISPGRDLAAWERAPHDFPYGVVEKRQMVRLEEGILPGHVVMLWRIHFGNFTTETVIPEYFEYRYGVDSQECIQTLLDKEYIRLCTAKETLSVVTVRQLKDILRAAGLSEKGRKAALLQRVTDDVREADIARIIQLRRYQILPAGGRLLHKYDDIIQRHGPKA